MTVIANDSFTRANGALGANWTKAGATTNEFTITSNTVGTASQSSDAGDLYTGYSTWPDDQYAKVVFSGTPTGTGADAGYGVFVRASTSATTGYWLVGNGALTNNTYLALRGTGGSYTRLALWTRTGGWLAGDTIELRVSGTTLEGFANGVSLGTVTDSTLSSGIPGLAYSSVINPTALDNWEGGSTAPVSVPLTGTSATGNVGSVSTTGDVTLGVTGLSVTGSVGILSIPIVQGILANRRNRAGRSPYSFGKYFRASIDMTSKNLNDSLPASLSGTTATGAVGRVRTVFSLSLVSNSATGQTGQVNPTPGILVNLTGLSATGAVNVPSISITAPLTGVNGSGLIGSISYPPVTGVTGTGVIGTLTPFIRSQHYIILSGR